MSAWFTSDADSPPAETRIIFEPWVSQDIPRQSLEVPTINKL